MLDMFGILLSTIAILFVMIRATMLDASELWFESEEASRDPNSADSTGVDFGPSTMRPDR